MSDYLIKTKNFIKELEKEDAYIEFMNYKKIVEKDISLKNKLEVYMKRRFELQVNGEYGEYNSYENLLALQREYGEFLSDPLVQKYLKAELEFSRLISRVFDVLSKNINLDLAFLK